MSDSNVVGNAGRQQEEAGITRFTWIPERDFMEQIFETSPFHFRNVLSPEYFGFEDLLGTLTTSATSALPFSIRLHGPKVPPQEYCSPAYNPMTRSTNMEIDPRKVEALLQKGASLKIQRFAKVSEKVYSIVTDIESWLGMATSANGYLSFGPQRGLDPHWDTHHVIAVQLIGRKKWKIFKPTLDQPLKSHRGHFYEPPRPDAVSMEIVLEAGDALYVPRGWWHDVMPVKGEKTLHITVGLHPPDRSDFWNWVLSQEILGNVEFRKAMLRRGPKPDFSPLLANYAEALNNPELIEKFWKQYSASIRPIGSFKLKGLE